MAVLIDTVAESRPRHPEKAHRPDQPALAKPGWIRVKAPVSPGYLATQKIVRDNGLHTVCEEAGCPNIGECWDKKHATFMIMGDTCTRACAFCNVRTGLPGALDAAEPERVAEATAKLGLAHIVVTSVDRDDLDDGGAAHFAAVIRAIRARCPDTTIEVLTPDFLRKDGAADIVVAARPDIFNHNLETVPSKYLTVRPGARYFASIRLLQRVKEIDAAMFTKSGIMVGLGEERNEVLQVMDDLRAAERRFPHHRSISAAVAQASSGRALRAARGIQRIGDHRLCQGFFAGRGKPADALLASCRRRFCPAEGVADGALTGCRNLRPCGGCGIPRPTCSISSPMSNVTRNSCRYAGRSRCASASADAEGREVIVADMTVAFKLIRETFTSRVTLDRKTLEILVEYLEGPFQKMNNRWTFRPAGEDACDVEFFIAYEFRSRTLGILMGAMFDAAFRRFSAAFEKRADEVYGIKPA